MSTGLGPTDLIVLFSQVFGEIATVRATRQLPTAQMHLGQEWLAAQESPPRIVVVPTANRFSTARAMGGAGFPPVSYNNPASINPKTFFRRLTGFDAYLWGDPSPTQGQPDPTEADLWYSFNSALELERELIIALAHNLGGPAAITLDGSRWEQRTDMTRLGRELVLSFAFETQVSQEPYALIHYPTQSPSG